MTGRSATSGCPISQKLSLLLRFFFRSSVSRSAFICAFRKSVLVISGFISSISLAPPRQTARRRTGGYRVYKALLLPMQVPPSAALKAHVLDQIPHILFSVYLLLFQLPPEHIGNPLLFLPL